MFESYCPQLDLIQEWEVLEKTVHALIDEKKCKRLPRVVLSIKKYDCKVLADSVPELTPFNCFIYIENVYKDVLYICT